MTQSAAEFRAALAADAEQLAAQYAYNAAALQHEFERRCFGSFTTTCAGSAEERDRFLRAWNVATERAKRLAQVDGVGQI